MGFFGSDIGRAVAGFSTGGLSELYRAMSPGGGQSGYAPIPFDYGANNAVDNNRISEEFQRAAGRGPTKSELEQYANFIKTGDLTYGDIGQIIKGLPEQDRARLDQYAQAYSDRLGAGDQQFLDKAAATAQSRFSSLGRPVTSGQAGAFAQSAQNLAQQRQASLAAFYGQGLQNNASQFVSQGQNALSRGQGLTDSRTAYNRSLMGYQTQRNDFNTDLSNENNRRKQQAWNTLPFTLAGAGVGGYFGGARGAQAGAGVGSQFGGLF